MPLPLRAQQVEWLPYVGGRWKYYLTSRSFAVRCEGLHDVVTQPQTRTKGK
jgi:hypothetical protein